MINVNDIYTLLNNGKEFRILWFSPETDVVFVIELTDNTLPTRISMSELQKQLLPCKV